MTSRLHLLLLALCGGLVYANALSGPFVFDDEPLIERNPDIRQLWPPIWAVTSEGLHAAVNSRPLTSLTLALNYALGGLAVEGYHLVNIGLHILCGLALYGVLRLLFGRVEALAARSSDLSFCGALLWLVHPLNSEVVNYISQRSASLMALCYLGTLYCFLRGANDRRWLWASVGCCGLGMMAKEVMVGAPLVVLVCDGLFVSGSYRVALGRRAVYYGGLALTWLLLVRGLWSAPHGTAIGFDLGVGTWTYLLNQAQMLTTYLWLVIWPHPLVLDYGYPRDLALGDVWLEGLGVLVLVGATAVAVAKGARWGGIGVLAFMALAPTSSFVPLVNEVGAERRMYLPLMGLAAGLVVAVDARCGRRVKLALCGCAALALAAVTLVRNGDYANEVAIWESSVAVVEDNPRAHYNLANELEAVGADERALAHYRRALALKPDYAAAHSNIGRLLAKMREDDAALAHYRRALELAPDLVEARYNLATALEAAGQGVEAERAYREALALDPGLYQAAYRLGLLAADGGRLAEAIGLLRQVLAIDSAQAQTHFHLGRVLAQADSLESALVAYRRSVALAPGLVAGHYNLGTELLQLGRAKQALPHLLKVVALQPDLPVARNNLGIGLLRSGRIEDSIVEFKRALALRPDYADARANLDAALAAARERPEMAGDETH